MLCTAFQELGLDSFQTTKGSTTFMQGTNMRKFEVEWSEMEGEEQWKLCEVEPSEMGSDLTNEEQDIWEQQMRAQRIR